MPTTKIEITNTSGEVVQSVTGVLIPTEGVKWANYAARMGRSPNTVAQPTIPPSGLGELQREFPNTQSLEQLYNWNDRLFNCLYLTDSEEPVSENVQLPKGNIVGVAFNDSLGSESNRGAYVRDVSFPTPTKYTQTFSFPHARANGKIQTIYMGTAIPQGGTLNSFGGNNFIRYRLGTGVAYTQNQMPRAHVVKDDFVYFGAREWFYEVNYKTSEVKRTALPENASSHQCQSGLIGRDFYYINTSNILVRLNLDTMTITGRTALQNTAFFEAKGDIYCPQSGLRIIRKYTADLSSFTEITVESTARTFGNEMFNYDYKLDTLISGYTANFNVSPAVFTNISTLDLNDFLVRGLNTEFIPISDLNRLTNSLTDTSQRAIHSYYSLENGNAIIGADVGVQTWDSQHAFLQMYKHQGVVGAVLKLDTPIVKTSANELVITIVIDIAHGGIVE